MSEALRIDGLSKVYAGGARALDDFSLTIRTGSFFGLLGPNGAGKTTVIGAISGLVRIGRGHVFVFGHDVARDLRTRLMVGVAPQEVHLDRFLTTREVLAYHGRYFGLRRQDADARAGELLEVFDLGAKAHVKPNRLSGGMRRRLVIARALAHRPQLVVLDEPTAGVDLEQRRELWLYLRKLQTEEGLSVLLTTHSIDEAEALCQRVAFIREGRVVQEGEPRLLVEASNGASLSDAYLQAMRA